MEKKPIEPPEVEREEIVQEGPHAGFLLKVYEEQKPDKARESYGVKQGYIGSRGNRKLFTTGDGKSQHSGSNHTTKN